MSLNSPKSGVYNVAGEGVVCYRKAIQVAGSRPLPLPSFIVYRTLGALSQFRLGFPEHLADFFRYSTVVSDESFRKQHTYTPQVSTMDALKSLRSLRAVVEPQHTST